MAHPLWTIFCAKALTDSENHNVSLLDVIEDVVVAVPEGSSAENMVVPISAILLTNWRRSDAQTPERFMARVSFVAPPGQAAEGPVIEVDLSNHLRLRMSVKIGALTIWGEGTHRFRIERQDPETQAWSVAAELPLEVHIGVEQQQ